MSDVQRTREQQLAQVPVVGPALATIREVTAPLRPTDDDSTAMVVAKRAGQVAAGVAITAVVII